MTFPKINFKDYIYFSVIAGLFLCLFLNKCNYESQVARQNVALDSLTLANQKLDSIKNELKQTVYTQTSIITDNQAEIKDLTDQKFNLTKKYEKKIKDVTFYYEAQLSAHIDNTFIPYKDTATIDSVRKELSKYKDTASLYNYVLNNMIKVPKAVTLDSVEDKYQEGIRLSGVITKTGFHLGTISIADTQYIRVVKLKRGFFHPFSKPKFQVQVLHSSQFINVMGQNSVIYSPVKKPNILLKALEFGGLIFLGSRL